MLSSVIFHVKLFFCLLFFVTQGIDKVIDFEFLGEAIHLGKVAHSNLARLEEILVKRKLVDDLRTDMECPLDGRVDDGHVEFIAKGTELVILVWVSKAS